jgi:hypothetical protein
MPRPCEADHEPKPATCRLCWLYANDRRYRARWDGRKGKAGQRPADCTHLGVATGARVACPTCAGRVELRLFHCAVYGECTTGKAAPGVACCQGCPDYESKGKGA